MHSSCNEIAPIVYYELLCRYFLIHNISSSATNLHFYMKITSTLSGIRTFYLAALVLLPVSSLRAQRAQVVGLEHGSLSHNLLGTWILAGAPGNIVEPASKGGRLKFFTGHNWNITQADSGTGVTIFHHGGTYTLSGDEYSETVGYANESTKTLIGQTFKFTVKVEGDTLTQVGKGNPYTEVWKRVKQGAQVGPIPNPEDIKGWGTPRNPAADCLFKAENDSLTITVPGSPTPHDLSPELNSSTAPCVLQPVSGDFTIEVKVDGEFTPGDDSTQKGRTGYTGAGLVVFADQANFIRLERATLQHQGGEGHAYINFEIRVDGQLQAIGTTGDFVIEAGKPTWLRLGRRGDQILGAVSFDKMKWHQGEPKQLTSNAWKNGNIVAGVAAISTSRQPFSPVYSNVKLEKFETPAVR